MSDSHAKRITRKPRMQIYSEKDCARLVETAKAAFVEEWKGMRGCQKAQGLAETYFADYFSRFGPHPSEDSISIEILSQLAMEIFENSGAQKDQGMPAFNRSIERIARQTLEHDMNFSSRETWKERGEGLGLQ